jgi:hypothetical protein
MLLSRNAKTDSGVIGEINAFYWFANGHVILQNDDDKDCQLVNNAIADWSGTNPVPLRYCGHSQSQHSREIFENITL